VASWFETAQERLLTMRVSQDLIQRSALPEGCGDVVASWFETAQERLLTMREDFIPRG